MGSRTDCWHLSSPRSSALLCESPRARDPSRSTMDAFTYSLSFDEPRSRTSSCSRSLVGIRRIRYHGRSSTNSSLISQLLLRYRGSPPRIRLILSEEKSRNSARLPEGASPSSFRARSKQIRPLKYLRSNSLSGSERGLVGNGVDFRSRAIHAGAKRIEKRSESCRAADKGTTDLPGCRCARMADRAKRRRCDEETMRGLQTRRVKAHHRVLPASAPVRSRGSQKGAFSHGDALSLIHI